MFRNFIHNFIHSLVNEAERPTYQAVVHQTGQLTLFSIDDVQRRRFYEGLAEQQRLSEIEDKQRRKW